VIGEILNYYYLYGMRLIVNIMDTEMRKVVTNGFSEKYFILDTTAQKYCTQSSK